MSRRPLPSGSRFARAIVTVAMSGFLAFASIPARAVAEDGPFAPLAGSWSGTGTIVMLNGAKERIRCNATHHVGASSNELKLELNCASDSYKFNLQSQIVDRDNAISGNWYETSRATGGAITGRINGSQISVRAEGQTFNALLSVTTRGERQAISIQSPGSEMSDVSITLARKSK